MYTVYILRSLKSGRYYKGQTNDLSRRLKEHNNGEEIATSRDHPWELVFSFECNTRSEAIKLEKKLKNITARERIEDFIRRHNGK